MDSPPLRPRGLPGGFFAVFALVFFLGAIPLHPGEAVAQTGLFFDEYAPNARTAAMGQAFTGLADGPGAAYYNPAGLGYVKDRSTVGYRYVQPDLRGRMSGSGPEPVEWERPGGGGISVSLVDDFDVKSLVKNLSWFEPLAWGLDFFMPLPIVNEFRGYADTGYPHFLRYDARPDILALTVAFAYRILPWLSIGGGVMPNMSSYQTSSNRVRLNAPPDDPVKGLDMTIHEKTIGDMAPVLGVLLKPPLWGLAEWVSLGASYRGEIGNYFGTGTTDNVLGVRAPNGKFIPIAKLPQGYVVNFVGFSPAQWTVGIGLKPMSGLVVDFDLTCKQWSEYRYWQDLPPSPAFVNTWTPRLGGEYVVPIGWKTKYMGTFRDVEVRAGYYFEPTPERNADGPMNILDSDQHVVSFGAALTTQHFETAIVRWETFLQMHILTERTYTNEKNANWPPVTFDARVYNFGLELSLDF